MASLSIRCGVNHSSIRQRRCLHLGADRSDSYPNRIATSRRSPSGIGTRISAAATVADYSVLTPCSVNPGFNNNGVPFSETLDEWMRDSAVEIVKNLREAPLLVQVFASNNGAATKLETEKAIAEDWPVVTGRWKDGETPPPDGVILVEELGEEEDSEEGNNGTRAWGIVVQGKGTECGPASYLLKTCRVGSGLGLCSTHFCLMKVQGFRESALSQLVNCWLLE